MLSLCKIVKHLAQGGKSPPAMRTTLASVAPILGRVVGWSVPTAASMEQPRAALPLINVRARAAAAAVTQKNINFSPHAR